MESIGNALKTIYARLGDIKLGETLEDGTTIGSIGSALGVVGVDLLDQTGELRNMGDVIEDLMDKWEGLTTAEQQAVAVQLAGKYQYNNLLALLDNADMYYSQLEDSQNSLGTINEQQAVYMESLNGKLNQLQGTFEGLMNTIFNVDSLKPFIETLTEVIGLFNNLAEAVGGGGAVLQAFGAISTKVFSNQISRSITNFASNRRNQSDVNRNNTLAKADLERAGLENVSDKGNQDLIDYVLTGNKYSTILSDEQRVQFNDLKDQNVSLMNQALAAEKDFYTNIDRMNKAFEALGGVEPGQKVFNLKDDGTFDIGLYTQAAEIYPKFIEVNESLSKINFDSASDSIEDLSESTQGAYLQTKDLLSLYENIQDYDKYFPKEYKKRVAELSDELKANLIPAIDRFEKEFENNPDLVSGSTTAIAELKSAINEISQGVDDDSLSYLISSIRELWDVLDESRVRVDTIKGVSIESMDEIVNKYGSFLDAIEAANQGRLAGFYEQKEIITQAQISNVITMASAVQSLAFSWTSFQNLGSLIVNEDLEPGEKMLQILLNLASSFPSALMGFADLSAAIKNFKDSSKDLSAINDKITQAEKLQNELATTAEKTSGKIEDSSKSVVTATSNATNAMAKQGKEAKTSASQMTSFVSANTKVSASNEKVSASSRIAAAAMKVQTTTAKASTAAMTLLSKGVTALSTAFKGLAATFAPLLAIEAIFTGISLITSGLSAAKEKAEQLHEQVIETGTASLEKSESINDARTAFQEVYKEFKDTGVVTEDLKTKTAEYASTLGIVMEQESIRATNLERINRQLESEYWDSGEKTEIDLSTANRELNNNSDIKTTTDIFDNDSWAERGSYESFLIGISDSSIDSTGKRIIQDGGFAANTTLEEKIYAQTLGLKYLDEKYKEYEDLYGTNWYENEAYKDDYENLMTARNDLVSWLPQEIRDTYLENQQWLIDYSLQSMIAKGETKNISIEDAIAKILNDGNVQSYITAFGEDSARYIIEGFLSEIGFSEDEIAFALVDALPNSDISTDTRKAYNNFYGEKVESQTQKDFDSILEEIGAQRGTQRYIDILDFFDNWEITLDQILSFFEAGNFSDLASVIDYLTTGGTDAIKSFKTGDTNTFRVNMAKKEGQEALEEEYALREKNLVAALNQEASNYGLEFIDEDTKAELAEKAASAIEMLRQSSLSEGEKLALLAEYIQNPTMDFEQAVQRAILGITDIEKYSEDLAYSIQEADKEIRKQFIRENGDDNTDKANERINKFNSMLDQLFESDEESMASFLEALPEDADWNAVFELVNTAIENGISPETIIEGLSNGEITVNIGNVDFGEDWTEEQEWASGVRDKFNESYAEYNRAYGNSTAEDTDYASSLIEYGKGFGLSEENVLNYINSGFANGKSLEQIQEDIRNAALGISTAMTGASDELQDAYFTLYTDLLDLGYNQGQASAILNSTSNAVSTLGLSDEQYLDMRSSYEGDAASFSAALQGVSNLGIGAESSILVMAELDPGTPDEINRQLEEMSQNGRINELRIEPDIQGMRNITDAMMEDSLGAEELEDYVSENIANAFGGASGQSSSIDDAYDLLGDSYSSQKMLRNASADLNLAGLGAQLNGLENLEEQLDSAENKLNDIYTNDGEIEINYDDVEDALSEIIDLNDAIEDQGWEIDINMAGDALDEANQLIEAIEDLDSAAAHIDENFQVDPDNIIAVSKAFPGILDGYSVTADGMIQLNSDIAQSALETAGIEASADAEAMSAKLQNQAEYANAMAEAYRAEAASLSESLSNKIVSNDNANALINESENRLNQARKEGMDSIDSAANTLASNEAQYAADSATSSVSSAADMATNVGFNLKAVDYSAASVANSLVASARVAWTAWNSIGKTSFNGGTASAIGSTMGGTKVGISKEDISSGEDIEYTDSDYSNNSSDDSSDGIAEVQNKIDEYLAKAEAYEQIGAILQGAAAQLGASAANPISMPGGSGGSGGGGGGGGGDAYDPEIMDFLDDEIDRYERVDTLLDAIGNDLDRIADEQERLTGHELVKNMENQISLLMRQIELQKEKLKIQKDEAAEYAEELKKYGIEFDGEGFISNYAEVYTAQLDMINALIAQYNATTTEEGQTALEETIDEQQEKFDKFNDLIEKYDDLVSNSIKDTLSQLEELEDSIEDIRIEAFQTSIEAVDNIKDIQETLIDFNAVFSGLDSEDPFRAMATSSQKLANYFDVAKTSAEEYYNTLINKQKEIANSKDATEQDKRVAEAAIKLYQNALKKAQSGEFQGDTGTGYLDMESANLAAIMEQIKQFEETGTSDIFGKDSADMYEVAQDIFESATSMITEYEEQVDELRDAILDAIDEIADRMEKRQEAFENITAEIEHQKSLIEMIYGEKSYDLMDQAYTANYTNYQNQIKEVTQQIEVWEDLLSNLTEGSDEWEAVHEKIVEAQQELNDLVESSIETLQQKYENAVNASLDTWIGKILGGNQSGFGDLDWVAEQWELINRNADQYLDEVQKSYNIQKLQAAYNKLLDGSNDLHIQQQISQQMEQQLEYLREKDKLSQYDVAYANAQLEILQRQIALEEAQRNKSQLKLRRDSQGNYSYVYTADEGDIAQAESDLLDAQNNAYELSKENMTNVQSDALQQLQNAYSMIQNVWTNANLTLEEKKERTQYIIDSLKEYLAGSAEQLGTTETNIINDFLDMWELLSEENRTGMEDIYDEIVNGNLDAFDQIDDRWSTSISDWLQHIEDFSMSTDEMFDELVESGEEFESNIANIGDLIGQDFDNMSDTIQNTVDKTNDLASSTADFINQLKDDTGVIREYEDTLTDYAEKIADVTNEMKSYQNQVNDLGSQLTQKEQENADLSNKIEDLENQIKDNQNNGSSSGSNSGGGGGNGSLADGIQVGDVVGFSGQYYYDSWGKKPAGSNFSGQANAVRIDEWSSKSYGGSSGQTGNFNVHISRVGVSTAQGDLGWVAPDQLFEKGGWYSDIPNAAGQYTGSFDQSPAAYRDASGKGRMAILHPHELVLNQEDTKNILKAVSAVRSMTLQYKNNAFDNLVSTLNKYGSELIGMPIANASNQGETTYNVECVFPNATSVEEIQQAILSLPEQVSQYYSSRSNN